MLSSIPSIAKTNHNTLTNVVYQIYVIELWLLKVLPMPKDPEGHFKASLDWKYLVESSSHVHMSWISTAKNVSASSHEKRQNSSGDLVRHSTLSFNN